MTQRIVDADETPAGLGEATLAALRRSVGPQPRKWLMAITLLLGVLGAVGVATGQPADRTFAKLSESAQILMSITVPFLGIVLVHDLKRVPRPARVTPTLLAATLLAAAIGVFGVLICASTLAVAPLGTAQDPWHYAGTIAVGSVLVQVVAQLVGTGLGLLLRSPVVAFLASIVLPLGLLSVLGRVDAFRPIQDWVTPYVTAQKLLSGWMRPIAWAQWFVVFLIWGVGLNTIGVKRLKR